jgi:hypothetical protein
MIDFCDTCQLRHVAAYSHAGQYNEGAIYAVVCTADGLVDYYTSERVTAEPRYYVHDRKVGTLATFTAVNPRYWVIDRTTGKAVDEFTSKAAANGTARDMCRSQA